MKAPRAKCDCGGKPHGPHCAVTVAARTRAEARRALRESKERLPAGFVITGINGAGRVDCGTSHVFTPPVPYPCSTQIPRRFRDARAANRAIARAVSAAKTHNGSLAEGIPAVRELVAYVPTLRVESLRKRAQAANTATPAAS